VALRGVERERELVELGFDGGAVAGEVEVLRGGFKAVEMEWEANVMLVEENGFD